MVGSPVTIISDSAADMRAIVLRLRRRPRDHLGEQRVVEPGHLEAGDERAVDPDPRPSGQHHGADAARPRHELGARVLGGDPALDRVAPERDLVLTERQGGARGNRELPGHQVDAGDEFGHRVFHLKPGVDLQKVERVAVDEELHRPGVPIAHGARGRNRRPSHRVPQRRAERRRRCLLDQLLMAALDRALPLPKMHDVAVPVGGNLDLDVPGIVDPAFQVHAVVAEGRAGLPAGQPERADQILRPRDAVDPLPAPAGRRFDQHGIPEAQRLARRRHVAERLRPGQHRHAGLADGAPGLGLVPAPRERLGGRADETDPVLPAGGGQRRILREKPVARMDGVRAGAARGLDHCGDAEI